MSAPCLCLEYAKILACERQLATLMFDSLFGVVVFPQPYYLYPLVAYKKSKLTKQVEKIAVKPHNPLNVSLCRALFGLAVHICLQYTYCNSRSVYRICYQNLGTKTYLFVKKLLFAFFNHTFSNFAVFVSENIQYKV
jgi:hypothetical protein